MHFTSGTVAMIRFSLATFAFLGTLHLAVGDTEVIEVGDRPVHVQKPPSYDPEVPMPLLLELHGYGGGLFGFRSAAKDAGFLYAAPTGGTRACYPDLLSGWNVQYTYCEQWANSCPDDSAYLREVIDSTMLRLAVDPQRIYVIGKSLGGMMTLRMACDHADILAGIVIFDGPWAIEEQRTSCVPSAPVHALHIFGTSNWTFRAGQNTLEPCPATPFFHIGAEGVAEEWAGYNGCSLDTEEGLPLDLVTTLPGDDTLVTRYTGCEHGGQVELWTIVGQDHFPSWTPEFYTNVLDWLLNHPKGSVSIMPIEYMDFNSDYIIDIEDLTILIEHWGQDEPSVDIAPAPFVDGIVDVADLEALMNHWGQELYDPDLIAHWKLDGTEGDIASDSAGENHADVMGEAVWQPEDGQTDGALQFDGIDDHLDTEGVLNPAFSLFFSVFAWVKGGGPEQSIISQQTVSNWLMTDADGALATALIAPSGDAKPLLSDTVVTDDQWHCVGFVWDGTHRILYVDDVEVARDMQSSLVGAFTGLYIGAGKGLELNAFWSGLIDDVRIHKRVVVP